MEKMENPENVKIVTMEELLKPSTETPEQAPKKKQKSEPSLLPTIPKGRPKSGRIWKSERKRFSSIVKSKGLRGSMERKLVLKEQLKHNKQLSDAIKSERQQAKEQKKERRRENLKRQEENRKKSEVVQVITNTKKLKKIKRKHIRTIEKRDTTVVEK